MNQQLLSIDTYFYSLSLGDAYPTNIHAQKLQFSNLSNIAANISTNAQIVDGDIVGNGQGGSAGRLGGAIYNKEKDQIVFVYS